MRFATEHVVATLLALLVHYIFTGLNILLSFVRWRFASLPPAKASAGGASRLRVLIPYANIGSGHKMAAEAIGGALKDLVQEHKEEMTADVEVELIDAMHLCNEVFRTVMQDWFQKLTQSLPGQHMLGYLLCFSNFYSNFWLIFGKL